MNQVHESFLRWINQQRNQDRLENYRTYTNYYNGDQNIDIPAKVEAALKSELGTRLNYCPLVVNAAVDYIAGGEIGVEAETPEAESFLNDIYTDNFLLKPAVEMLKTLTVMCKKGDVFLKLWIDEGEIKITVLRPDIVFPRYMTDDYTKMHYCAIQFWEDPDEDFVEQEGGKWHAHVFYPDRVDYYELEGTDETEYTAWNFKKSEENPLGFIPIIHLKNTIDDLEFGVSDLQVMIDLQDALNKCITDMLLAMDQTAFQRMWVFGVQSPKGQEISMEPGKVTEVADPEGHLDIVSPAPIAPYIDGLREIVDQIMTVTQLSKVTIMKPDVPLPPSGFALRIHYIPLERKASKKVAVLQQGFQRLNEMIFAAGKILNKGDFTGQKTEIHFDGGLPVDEQMQMQINESNIRMKVRSRRTVMEETGVEDVEREKALIQQEAEEDLALAIELEVAKAAFQPNEPKSEAANSTVAAPAEREAAPEQ